MKISLHISPRLPELHRGPAAAFTLIELLVAIAIIAILAAIAVPAVRSAMLSAKSAESVSNLKAIGALVANYAADNNNRLPLSAYWPSTLVFQNILVSHFEDLRSVNYNPKAKLNLPGMFYDPVLRGQNEHPWGSFGVNSAVVLDSNRYRGGTAKGVGMPLAGIPDPSRKVICSSAIEPGWASSWGFDGEVFARKGFDPSYGPDPRNAGGAVSLFADGHIEKLDVENMDKETRKRLFMLDP